MKISFENPDKINGLMTLTVEEADYKENVEKKLKQTRWRKHLQICSGKQHRYARRAYAKR